MNGKKIKYISATVALLACSLLVQAQKQYKPKFNKSRQNIPQSFPSHETFQSSGWLFGAGLTGLLSFREQEHSFNENEQSLTTRGGYTPFLTAEIGRYYNFQPVLTFSYLNYGLAYKGQLATERFSESGSDRDNVHRTLGHYASAYFDLNSVISISSRNFIQNSIGVNVDYGVVNAESKYDQGIPSETLTNLAAQVNYKLGLGIKFDSDVVLIPYGQVNVLNLYPQQKNFHRLDAYNTSYVPVQLGVRVLLFQIDRDKCPDVDGSQVPAGFKNGYGED